MMLWSRSARLGMPLVLLIVATACGQENKKSDRSPAVNGNLATDTYCQPGAQLQTPIGQEPVPVFPGPGEPGYQPVPGGPSQPGPGFPGPIPGKGDCIPLPPGQGGPIVVNPGSPGQFPGQIPGGCQSPCGPGPGSEPFPFPPPPSQGPIFPPDSCGKPGIICDHGPGSTQIPPFDIGSHPLDGGDVHACLAGLRGRGIDTRGAWGVEVRELKAVSILSSGIFEDYSRGPKIVLIEATSIGGSLVGGFTEFNLGNPHALYCIRSLAVLDDLQIGSCWSNNIAFMDEFNFMSNRRVYPLNCH